MLPCVRVRRKRRSSCLVGSVCGAYSVNSPTRCSSKPLVLTGGAVVVVGLLQLELHSHAKICTRPSSSEVKPDR